MTERYQTKIFHINNNQNSINLNNFWDTRRELYNEKTERENEHNYVRKISADFRAFN